MSHTSTKGTAIPRCGIILLKTSNTLGENSSTRVANYSDSTALKLQLQINTQQSTLLEYVT